MLAHMATYSAAVERWRPLVEKYFPPNLVDKALYVIQGESGGDPTIVGDNGVAIGLFQIQSNKRFEGRPDENTLKDPEANIRYAAQQLGAANDKWTDWGEGATYEGQAFGALGNNPYGGGSGGNAARGSQLMAPPELPFDEKEYQRKFARAQALHAQLNDPLGNPNQFTPVAGADPNLLNEFFTLSGELRDYEKKRDSWSQDWNTYLETLDYSNKNDPRVIDATNAANDWNRKFSVNQQAAGDTTNDMQEQRATQAQALDSSAKWRQSNHFDSPLGFQVPSTNLPTAEEVFKKNVDRISGGLPQVPGLPYSQQLPAADSKPLGIGQSFGKPATPDDLQAGAAAFQKPGNGRTAAEYNMLNGPRFGATPAKRSGSPVTPTAPGALPSGPFDSVFASQGGQQQVDPLYDYKNKAKRFIGSIFARGS